MSDSSVIECQSIVSQSDSDVEIPADVDNSAQQGNSARTDWDVIVIGGGPAGSLVSRLLAQRGRSVLLVEAKAFPRDKVCGGCLSPRAVAHLDHAGLGHLPIAAGAIPLDAFEICLAGTSTRFPLHGGFSLSRRTFDQHLLYAAIAAGVHVMARTTAMIDKECIAGRRIVAARHNGNDLQFSAKCVVCADGLLRSAARQLPELAAETSTQSYVGIGTCIASPSQALLDRIRPGTISMAVGHDGYVGLAQHERGGLSIAAAISPVALKSAKRPEVILQKLMLSVGMPSVENSGSIDWQGTPLLTSRAGTVATERVFVIGDAAGYVEPFTGEGMAAALESAWLSAPLIDQAINEWNPLLVRRWQTCYCQAIQERQWAVRGLGSLLRYPRLTRSLLGFSRLVPSVPRWLISRINDARPSHVPTESTR